MSLPKRVYRAPVPVSDREAMDAIAKDDIAFHHEDWRDQRLSLKADAQRRSTLPRAAGFQPAV